MVLKNYNFILSYLTINYFLYEFKINLVINSVVFPDNNYLKMYIHTTKDTDIVSL